MSTPAHSAVYDALARGPLLRQYASAFGSATGLSLRLVPADAPSRRAAQSKNQNPFCKLMGQHAGACAACVEIQRELQQRLARKLAPQQVCCFAGLTELAVPVLVAGRHVATLLGGQVFRRKPRRSQFAGLLRHLRGRGLRHSERQLKRAYLQTPIVSEKQFRAAVRLLSLFASQLAEQANRYLLAPRRDEPPQVVEAKKFVQANARQPLRLREAAAHVHLSVPYFCRVFRRATGITFTEFVARVRVDKAQQLLANPHLRMHETADAAGFDSISQFNRSFRRYTGASPTVFRRQFLRSTG